MTNPATTDSTAMDKTTTQLREFGDRTIKAGREVCNLILNTYENTVASLVEFEQRAAEAANNDWVKVSITAHAGFLKNINVAYINAVRAALAD
jgi:hypothetical protein